MATQSSLVKHRRNELADGRRRIVKTYDFTDENANLLMQEVRYEPKGFRMRRPTGKDSWSWNLEGVRHVLYNLPDLRKADSRTIVYVVEGPKDADRLISLGLLATTNPMGAGKWRPEYSEEFRKRTVVILPDNDIAGRNHAAKVRDALQGVANAVVVVMLPGLPEKGDVSNYLDIEGNTVERLLKEVERTWHAQSAAEHSTEYGTPDETDSWEFPVPLNTMANAPDFPLRVLPNVLQRIVHKIASATNSPPDYAAVPALTIAAACIGNARHLAITNSHTQAPCIFAGCVGRPGTTKTAPLKILRKAVDAAQRRCLDDWQKELTQWEAKEENEQGTRPTPGRIVVGDTTTESLAVIWGENPRGVLMLRNELMRLIAGMNQYRSGGRGHDRQVYLDVFDTNTIAIDRKSDKTRQGVPLYVQDPYLSIYGTLQPDVLPRLRGEVVRGIPPADDGWFDRWLLVYPSELPLPRQRHGRKYPTT
jgi:5S rRNA maturation endonuclease (ribonuclease M5)